MLTIERKRRYELIKERGYGATVRWTDARKGAISAYRDYSREHVAVVEGKPVLRLSAGGAFLGDDALHNAEDLLVIALSGCHLLTYLAKCARAGLRVLSYEDQASGTMAWDGETYRFSEVVLRPRVVVEEGGDLALAEEMQHRSHDLCFIARSVNFSVKTEPEFLVAIPPLSGDSTDDAQPVNTDARCSREG